MDILFDLLIIFIICMYFGLKDDNDDNVPKNDNDHNVLKDDKKEFSKKNYSKIASILLIIFFILEIISMLISSITLKNISFIFSIILLLSYFFLEKNTEKNIKSREVKIISENLKTKENKVNKIMGIIYVIFFITYCFTIKTPEELKSKVLSSDIRFAYEAPLANSPLYIFHINNLILLLLISFIIARLIIVFKEIKTGTFWQKVAVGTCISSWL